MNPGYLDKPSFLQSRELLKVLFSWPECQLCAGRTACTCETCMWIRAPKLNKYMQYYREITEKYNLQTKCKDNQAVYSHETFYKIIGELKNSPDIPKRDLISYIFPQDMGSLRLEPDIEAAVDTSVAVMLMIDCSAKYTTTSHLEGGFARVSWRSEQTLCEFLEIAFPLSPFPLPEKHSSDARGNLRKPLTAKRLKKYAKLKFKPTDDLRNHLRLNRDRDSVEIFHHTAFLKEHLRLTRDKPQTTSTEEYIKYGAIPRQIALEALDSIQKILFPLSNLKSHQLLCSLVASAGFDPDCTQWESNLIRRDDEKNITYQYFGARLADLYEELENPRPHGLIETWVERRKGARDVMLATLVGVVIAIVLGILSLVVDIYSAWVGYQQWKHPVRS